MKTTLKILSVIALLIVAFYVGIFVASPKEIVNHELENKFAVLDGYRKWEKKEVQPKRAPIEKGFGIVCEDGSLPIYRLYSGFGNSMYSGMFIGGSFDGYFYSVRVVECSDHYFINENGDSGKYFGPFTFNTKYNY